MRFRVLFVLVAGSVLAGFGLLQPLQAQLAYPFAQGVPVTARPAGLLGLLFTPREAQSGQPIKLTIALTAPAPTGGCVVPLYSSDAKLLPVPKSIRVPAGLSRLQVTITAPAIKALSRLTISTTAPGSSRKPARAGADTRRALLTIHP